MGNEPVILPGAFFRRAELFSDRIALRHKRYGIWHKVTWKSYAEQVRTVAAGLISLGLKKGQPVCILGENRPEWLICHLATMTVGGCTCGIYPTSSTDEIQYVLTHAETQLLFVENEEQLDKILKILPDLALDRVIIWDTKGMWGFSHPKVMVFDDFLAEAARVQEQQPEALQRRYDALTVEDTAMIIYTSGTTGRPKGALLSHANISSVVQAFLQVIPINEKDEVVSYLPLAHVYENLVSVFTPLFTGAGVSFVESMETLAYNLHEVSPTIFGSVPRIWEKFASNIRNKMDEAPLFKRWCFNVAFRIGTRYVRAKADGQPSFSLKVLYQLAYWGVFYHLKRQLGFERIRWALCSAAPSSKELFEFFNLMGIPLRDGYGQTESTGVIALQRLDKEPRYGYVGEALPRLEMKLGPTGEILARGPGVFKGYFKNPELTAETLRDGWLHTGDLGQIDDGHLKIVGRIKDIIVTSGGKNITPEYIENKLKFSNFIQDAIVIGDNRHYIVALILIDEENCVKYAQDHRIAFTTFTDLTQNEEIIKLIQQEVNQVNDTLARVETVKKFRLIPRRFYSEDGDVTPTLKIKRANIAKMYKDLIDAMY
jgi:long-chain acyl-CoA synthetase